jgi:hypothetical protein
VEYSDNGPSQGSVAPLVPDLVLARVTVAVRTPRRAQASQDGPRAEPDFISVCALRVPEEPVEIDLSRRLVRGIRLTPDEAQHLVEALQLVLRQIGG